MALSTLKGHTKGIIGNPALLFLHAFPLSSDMWTEQMNRFSENFYCLAPYFPGFGESPLPDHAVTFEYYVDCVLNFLKESKVDSAIWCGLSMGGYIALRMYERAPEQCRALVLCDTKAGADGNEAKLKRWEAIKALQKNREEFTMIQWQTLVAERSKENDVLKARFQELVGKVSEKGISAGLLALATRTDTTPGLSKISVPTLILVGEEDKVTPISESEIIAKGISGSQMKTLEKTGHLSNLENPQKFNACLADFFTQLRESTAE